MSGGMNQFNPARGLRDQGNGANDTAGQYGITLNAMPDPVILRNATVSIDPMYPKMDKGDEKYMLATKGFLALQDTRWNHQSTSEFRNDLDIVYYVDNFAGLYNKADSIIEIIEHLAYVGLVDNDVLPIENSGKDNTTTWSGKKTIRNTGNARILNGKLIFWDMPPPGATGAARGGVHHMTDVGENCNPAWTVPYDPIIHKGSPQLIYNAIKHLKPNPTATDAGLEAYANEWISAARKLAIVVATSAGADQNQRDSISALSNETLADLLLNPAANLLARGAGDLPPLASLPQKPFDTIQVHGGTVFSSNTDLFAEAIKSSLASRNSDGRTSRGFEPLTRALTPAQEINLMQLTAAEDLFFYQNKINSFYTNRIFGEAIMSCDPGKDFDIVPVRVLNSS